MINHVEQQHQLQSPVSPSDRADSTQADTTNKAGESVPASIKIGIDLKLDPVVYHYESWSEMADGWIPAHRETFEHVRFVVLEVIHGQSMRDL